MGLIGFTINGILLAAFLVALLLVIQTGRDLLESVNGIIPVADGRIKMNWKRTSDERAAITLDLIGGVEVNLELPEGWGFSQLVGNNLHLKSGENRTIQLIKKRSHK